MIAGIPSLNSPKKVLKEKAGLFGLVLLMALVPKAFNCKGVF
jgi:hypothetical protein